MVTVIVSPAFSHTFLKPLSWRMGLLSLCFPCRTLEVDLDDFSAVAVAGIADVYGDCHSIVGVISFFVQLQVGILVGRVTQAMSEREKDGTVKVHVCARFLFVSVLLFEAIIIYHGDIFEAAVPCCGQLGIGIYLAE